jgi:hypothetical protein
MNGGGGGGGVPFALAADAMDGWGALQDAPDLMQLRSALYEKQLKLKVCGQGYTKYAVDNWRLYVLGT